jgi:hypothetical protein
MSNQRRSRDDGEGDFERTKETPIDFLRLRVLQLGPTMGVDSSAAIEAFGIFATAFGVEWLNAAATDSAPSSPIAFRRHPIGDLVSTAGPEQVAELFELADYLRTLQDAPGIAPIIDGLKGQYYQTLLQVAFAARLKVAGLEKLSVEPPAAAGRFSDIHGTFGGVGMRFECYRPTVKRDTSQDESTRLAQSILVALKKSPVLLSIGIAFTQPLTAAMRKVVRHRVMELANEVIASAKAHPETVPAFTISSDFCSVSVTLGLPAKPSSPPRLFVAPQFAKQDQDFDLFLRANFAYQADMIGLDADHRSGIGTNQVGIWLCDETREQRSLKQDLTRPLEKLGNRIEAKLAQARSISGDRRIVIVGTWMTNQLGRVDTNVVERLRKKILVSHENVAALLLVSRNRRGPGWRHSYIIKPLFPDQVDRQVAGLIHQLQTLETSN